MSKETSKIIAAAGAGTSTVLLEALFLSPAPEAKIYLVLSGAAAMFTTYFALDAIDEMLKEYRK